MRGRSKKISEKTLELREKLWPDIDNDKLWIRTEKVGFTTIPRLMPHILRTMDELSGVKPASSTYFALWCRVFDECMVTIKSQQELAYESGFTGQRAEATWLARMKLLKELGFIDAKPGSSGDYHFVLIWNPYAVIKKHFENGKIQERRYYALLGRAQEVGATDLIE